MSAGDSPWAFVVSLLVALVLPALFLAFESEYLWLRLGGGGKFLAVLFAYLTLVMWTSMLRSALSDPGIIPRGLHEPDVELVAVPPGTSGDQGNGMAPQPKHRLVAVRAGQTVISKWCETCQTCALVAQTG